CFCIAIFNDSVHSPKALPLGWDITGFQPYGVCAVTVSIIAFLHSPFSMSFHPRRCRWAGI
ncbi:MAG: hypothetical protein LBT78_02910, partial [Tannerella sp.]|nr:hypothetical protein [Tannerella sp.]